MLHHFKIPPQHREWYRQIKTAMGAFLILIGTCIAVIGILYAATLIKH